MQSYIERRFPITYDIEDDDNDDEDDDDFDDCNNLFAIASNLSLSCVDIHMNEAMSNAPFLSLIKHCTTQSDDTNRTFFIRFGVMRPANTV